MSLAPIVAVPSEILQQTLTHCHPRDVASFSQTCRYARDVIYSPDQRYLWRELFLSLFEDPRLSVSSSLSLETGDSSSSFPSRFDWRTELQRRVHVEVLVAEDIDRHEVFDGLLDVAKGLLKFHVDSPDGPVILEQRIAGRYGEPGVLPPNPFLED